MAGPRRDKERAWEYLEECVERCITVISLQTLPEDRPLLVQMVQEVRHRYRDLADLGCVNATQVNLIRYLLRDTWKLLSCGVVSRTDIR